LAGFNWKAPVNVGGREEEEKGGNEGEQKRRKESEKQMRENCL